MVKTYNLFISHSWAYSDAYEKFTSLLDNRDYFFYNNYSIPRDDPIHTNGTDRELKEAISRKMKPCHVVIVMAGKYSTFSKWIKKEIDIANSGFSNPKPILAVRPWASLQASSIVQENAVDIVGWNTESIVSAIRKLG